MILDTIAASTRNRVEVSKKHYPPELLRQDAEAAPNLSFRFEKALQEKGMSFICEVKKASPSKGVIAEAFPYLQIAREYEEAKATAISVLTEPEFFLGSNEYLEQIGRQVNIPLLRKDFTIDPYQIYEARVLGASAVLLICELLDEAKLRSYLNICDGLGLSALVEAHDEAQIRTAIHAGARIIGVNNRNLKTFTVDFNNSIRLRNLVPSSILFVAESGIKDTDDIRLLHQAGVDAVLIGETLMRSPDKTEQLQKWREASRGKN